MDSPSPDSKKKPVQATPPSQWGALIAYFVMMLILCGRGSRRSSRSACGRSRTANLRVPCVSARSSCALSMRMKLTERSSLKPGKKRKRNLNPLRLRAPRRTRSKSRNQLRRKWPKKRAKSRRRHRPPKSTKEDRKRDYPCAPAIRVSFSHGACRRSGFGARPGEGEHEIRRHATGLSLAVPLVLGDSNRSHDIDLAFPRAARERHGAIDPQHRIEQGAAGGGKGYVGDVR